MHPKQYLRIFTTFQNNIFLLGSVVLINGRVFHRDIDEDVSKRYFKKCRYLNVLNIREIPRRSLNDRLEKRKFR